MKKVLDYANTNIDDMFEIPYAEGDKIGHKIDYSDSFEKAIEGKVTAEQEALKAKNKTVQVEEEAKQRVIAAEAEAKSMAIRANALTQNHNLIQYELAQKWDGKLPQYMMGNSVPFINLK